MIRVEIYPCKLDLVISMKCPTMSVENVYTSKCLERVMVGDFCDRY
jgi:hypothetical protein